MIDENAQPDCYICRKHRGKEKLAGEVIYQDDLIFISHAAIPQEKETGYLGAILIEPQRHAPGMADLTDEEAQHIGLWAKRMSIALKQSEKAEHVYLFVMGHHVDHLHLWLVPRYPGTPREYWGTRVDEWPEAPHGNNLAITQLCRRLQNFTRQWIG